MIFLAIPAILATHFGFAGTLGKLIYWTRAEPPSRYTLGALALGGLLFLPSSLILPLSTWLRYLAWLGALALITVFSVRPARLPEWLWSPKFAFRYLGGMMLSIALWSLSAGPSPPGLSLGALAAMAAGLAWRRSGYFIAIGQTR